MDTTGETLIDQEKNDTPINNTDSIIGIEKDASADIKNPLPKGTVKKQANKFNRASVTNLKPMTFAKIKPINNDLKSGNPSNISSSSSSSSSSTITIPTAEIVGNGEVESMSAENTQQNNAEKALETTSSSLSPSPSPSPSPLSEPSLLPLRDTCYNENSDKNPMNSSSKEQCYYGEKNHGGIGDGDGDGDGDDVKDNYSKKLEKNLKPLYRAQCSQNTDISGNYNYSDFLQQVSLIKPTLNDLQIFGVDKNEDEISEMSRSPVLLDVLLGFTGTCAYSSQQRWISWKILNEIQSLKEKQQKNGSSYEIQCIQSLQTDYKKLAEEFRSTSQSQYAARLEEKESLLQLQKELNQKTESEILLLKIRLEEKDSIINDLRGKIKSLENTLQSYVNDQYINPDYYQSDGANVGSNGSSNSNNNNNTADYISNDNIRTNANRKNTVRNKRSERITRVMNFAQIAQEIM